jgi:hypothetical protein
MCVGCSFTPVTYFSKLLGIALAAFLQLDYLGYIRFLRYASTIHPFMDFSESVANAESGKVSPQ